MVEEPQRGVAITTEVALMVRMAAITTAIIQTDIMVATTMAIVMELPKCLSLTRCCHSVDVVEGHVIG